MTPGKRMAVFYSAGAHFTRALEALRAQDPGAHITAIVPRGHPAADAARGVADRVEITECPVYSPRDWAACFRLVRGMRAARYDGFFVLYDSPRLKMLAALSGARARAFLTASGECFPLAGGVASVSFLLALCRLWGFFAYAGMWLAVRCLPVRGGKA